MKDAPRVVVLFCHSSSSLVGHCVVVVTTNAVAEQQQKSILIFDNDKDPNVLVVGRLDWRR